jgi:hypothetical protein
MINSVARNWVPDNSHAPRPPDYFLQRVYDYDALLVILPSRDQPGAYVIARRKQFGRGVTEAAIDSVYTKADTKMCVMHGAVPVCLMYQSGVSWDPEQIIKKLAARDMWAHGGPDKVADLLEAQEEKAKAAIQADIRADLYNRSGDAWRSYQARTGQSSIKFHDNYPAKSADLVADSPPTGEVAAPTPTAGARSTAGLGDRVLPASTPRLSVGAEPKG